MPSEVPEGKKNWKERNYYYCLPELKEVFSFVSFSLFLFSCLNNDAPLNYSVYSYVSK